MGFGQAIDNMNNNFKRMFSPGNILLGISNTGIRAKIGTIRDYRKQISSLGPKEFAYGAGAIGFATRGVRSLMYLKECQSIASKYIRVFTNPNSAKIDEDQMDKDIEFLEKQFDRYQSYKEAKLRTVLILQKPVMLSQIDFLLKAATDVNSDPSKFISQGYKLLDDLRKKRHAAESSKLAGTAKLEETKKNLEKAEDLFKFWEKFKQYTYRLLNDDIRRTEHALKTFVWWVEENGRRAEEGKPIVCVNTEAAYGEKWKQGSNQDRDAAIQELSDDEA